MSQQRPGWDEYFLNIAAIAATRSTCLRRQVGAVIVRNNYMVSSGYNGAPTGVPHCEVSGCIRQSLGIPSGQRHEVCRGAHAEINAICQAAAMGVSTMGGTLYCTHEPCVYCTKAIINAGIVRVVYSGSYPDEFARELRSQSDVMWEMSNREAL